MPPLRERGEDIALLFRLFAMQMAEKYRMEKVTLTDEARQMLLRYKWPGNVRQLKNITEQISILCTERTITPALLAQFIPQDQESTQLAPIAHKGEGHGFEGEREILYKILFELRGNVNDLRRELSQLKKQMEGSHGRVGVVAGKDAPLVQQTAPMEQARFFINQQKPQVEEAVAEEYIEPTPVQESLNLSELGRQMIEKALDRNGGNRKKAAAELGISDRTLYRKIKQYGLDSKDKDE